MKPGTIIVEGNSSEVTVTGYGELDLSNAGELGRALRDASETTESLAVDIRPATFIDTAVLEYIARAAATMLNRGRRLRVLTQKNSHPLYVLKTAGFQELVDIVIDDTVVKDGAGYAG
ncbi:MAG: STAS domain-containing protein [Armatimonadota bacterium]